MWQHQETNIHIIMIPKREEERQEGYFRKLYLKTYITLERKEMKIQQTQKCLDKRNQRESHQNTL